MSVLKFFKPVIVLLLMIITSKSSSQELFDNFSGEKLDRSIWKVANRKWGDHEEGISHGGVVPANVYLKNGKLVICGNGDLYTGAVKGHGQNHRVGGAISSRKRFGPGRYEVCAKIIPKHGVLSAFWTFYYKNKDMNHEIDIEIPARDSAGNYNLNWGIFTSWRGISSDDNSSVNKYLGNITDGNYHVFRFDWFAEINGQPSKVAWYVDNNLIHTSFQTIPDKPSHFWLGVWFPWWIGSADFATEYMFIDWVKISAISDVAGK
jgi:beta-glucanase (GH16 family)